MKKFFKWSGLTALFAILCMAIIPFLIPIAPLDNLGTARQLAEAEDKFITLPFTGTDGIDIRYRDTGSEHSGRTFLMLHGSVFNAATWDEVTEVLATKGRVVAYDQIPYGLSEKLVPGDWEDENPYRIEAVVDRLFQLMDALKIERATLIANSYGAVIAVRAAATNPDRIDGLVLGDAAVYVSEGLPTWLMDLPQVDRMGPLIARGIGASETFVKSTWLDANNMSEARLSKTLIHTNVEDWDGAFWAYLKAWKLSDLTQTIAKVRAPALVITGDSDQVVPIEDSERLHNSIQGSDMVVLPNCGHVPQEECPDAFSAAVLDWVSRAE